MQGVAGKKEEMARSSPEPHAPQYSLPRRFIKADGLVSSAITPCGVVGFRRTVRRQSISLFAARHSWNGYLKIVLLVSFDHLVQGRGHKEH